MMTRALLNPLPGRPCGPNVRCKKTYRATQRTNHISPKDKAKTDSELPLYTVQP